MFLEIINAILYFILKCFIIFAVLVVICTVLMTLYYKYFVEGPTGICRCTTKLNGKVVLVTGGNAGIGLETARDLARRGARVIIATRNVQKSAAAVRYIISTTGNDKVEYKSLDLTSFKKIREFAEDFNRSYDRLDILINNAGLAKTREEISEDGFDKVLQANYLGAFLLTNLLLEKLINSKPSRIVIVSSWMHNFTLNIRKLEDMNTKYQFFKYPNSKLCDLLWTKALAKRLPEGVTVNALHPGAIATDIFSDMPLIWRIIFKISFLFVGKTTEEGAMTTIHAAVSEDLTHVTGKYFKDCKTYYHSKKAKDEKLIETIWKESLEITKHELPEHLLKS